MSSNILNDFLSFLNKSATVIGGQDGQIQKPQIMSGTPLPREGQVDMVNNSTTPGMSTTSHGTAQGAPLKAKAIKFENLSNNQDNKTYNV
jgi:hypothetical protein